MNWTINHWCKTHVYKKHIIKKEEKKTRKLIQNVYSVNQALSKRLVKHINFYNNCLWRSQIKIFYGRNNFYKNEKIKSLVSFKNRLACDNVYLKFDTRRTMRHAGTIDHKFSPSPAVVHLQQYSNACCCIEFRDPTEQLTAALVRRVCNEKKKRKEKVAAPAAAVAHVGILNQT